jgi:hypothetical protein
MWPWLKRWRDWVMTELWPNYRTRPQPQALHFAYEKGGLFIPDQPVPWNAEAIVVEASLRLPPASGRRKSDFQLRVPGFEPSLVADFRREDNDIHRITFRIPAPGASVQAALVFREKTLDRITLPFLSRDEFLQGLRLQMTTLFVRVGHDTVSCETFVATQCKGLLASAVLTSPTSLVPLLDLDLQVEFRGEKEVSATRVPARLCSSQLRGRQALATVTLKNLPRRVGIWRAAWLLGGKALAEPLKVRGITQARFRRSLRVSDTRFVVQSKSGGEMRVSRQLPPVELLARGGPCFLISSAEKGMAGICRLQAVSQVHSTDPVPAALEQEVLITDGPTMFAPGTIDAADLARLTGFELRCGRRALGVLSLRPAPTAMFNSEGGFKPVSDYTWSSAAEEEMNERLNRLLDGPIG